MPGQPALPVYAGILLASEQGVADVAGVLFLGGLSLDGSLRHLQGVLPMVGLAGDCGMSTVEVTALDGAASLLLVPH